MRDLYSNILVSQAIAPAVQAASVNGTAIDTQGAGRVAFAVNTGAIDASGAFSVKLQESDTGSSGWTDAPDEHVQTNAPAVLEASKAYKLGYVGWKRFVRPVLTKASGTSIAAGVVAILCPFDRPVA